MHDKDCSTSRSRPRRIGAANAARHGGDAIWRSPPWITSSHTMKIKAIRPYPVRSTSPAFSHRTGLLNSSSGPTSRRTSSCGATYLPLTRPHGLLVRAAPDAGEERIAPGEYSFVAVGSTQRRFDAMVAGQAAGGVVATPFDLLGQQKYGFHVLGSAIDVLGHYQATAVMARRSWRRRIAERSFRSCARIAPPPPGCTIRQTARKRSPFSPQCGLAGRPRDANRAVGARSPASYSARRVRRRRRQYGIALRAAYATPKKALARRRSISTKPTCSRAYEAWSTLIPMPLDVSTGDVRRRAT